MLGLVISFILTLCNKTKDIIGWLSIGACELGVELAIFAIWLN